jgi:hypothetical protein
VSNETAGYVEELTAADGTKHFLYIIRFNKQGQLVSNQTASDLETLIKAEKFTNIFLFSHGWNNDWETAIGRYKEFFAGYTKLKKDVDLKNEPGYKPLLIGIFWPGTALVFGENEVGPDATVNLMAADHAEDSEKSKNPALTGFDLNAFKDFIEDADHLQLLKDLSVPDSKIESKTSLEVLITIAKKIQEKTEDEYHQGVSSSDEELIKNWVVASNNAGNPDHSAIQLLNKNFIGDILDSLDPRHILRLFTVAIMKDRAGKVGYYGVGPFLERIKALTSAKIHLIGHSYGCKVLLSALISKPVIKVHSALLLQPAISYLAFAKTIPTKNYSGGYRPTLNQVKLPLLSTFSNDDLPLYRTFHLALRRDVDLGDIKIKLLNLVANYTYPPSIYAALGGYGPSLHDGDAQIIKILDPVNKYSFAPQYRIYGLESNNVINGHGEIANRYTYWALYSQVMST